MIKKTGQHGFKKVSGGGFEQEYSNGNYVKVDPDNKVYEVTVWDEKKARNGDLQNPERK